MINPLALLFLGLLVGILTGFFGIGGGWLLTPALNILGFQMVYAIGTAFLTLAGKTLFAAIGHYRVGNVDLRLGITIGLFSIPGLEVGKRLVLYLEKLNLAGTYVRAVYIVFLVSISMLMIRDYYRFAKGKKKGQEDETRVSQERTPPLAHHIRLIGPAPKISFPSSGVDSISLWVLILLGISIGLLSGFMGLGGGFIGLPLLIYAIGLPTITAVGTSLIIVLFTSCCGTVLYALARHVEWKASLIILAGSFIGVQLGVYATKCVADLKIRILFALLVLAVAISIFLKQINIVAASSYLVLSSACTLCLAILLPLGKRLLKGSLRQ